MIVQRPFYAFWKKYRYLIGIFISILVFFLIIISSHLFPVFFQTFENKALDWRFRLLTDSNTARKDIVIIDIDEGSIKAMEPLFGRWPWPRTAHAMLIQYLKQAKAVAFDVLFTEESKSIVSKDTIAQTVKMIDEISKTGQTQRLKELSQTISSFYQGDDEILAQTMREVPNVYLAAVFLPEGKKGTDDRWIKRFGLPYAPSLSNLSRQKDVVLPLKGFCQSVKGIGHINKNPDDDGVIRHALPLINFNQRFYPSLSLRVAIDILNPKKVNIRHNSISLDNIKIPIDNKGQMLINYTGKFRTYKYYPYWALIYSYSQMASGETPIIAPEEFKDKVILVGSTAEGLMDLRVTPFSSFYAGVETHANIIDNILSNSFLKTPSVFVSWLSILILILITGFTVPRLKPIIGAIVTIEILILYCLIVVYFFNYHRVWLEVFRPILSVSSSYLFILIYRYMTVDKEQKQTKDALSHYVNPSVAEEILKDPEKLKLWGEEKVLTVLFSDIRGFTTLSEQIEPTEIVNLLNEYLNVMTKAVFKYNGTLDKYVGDAIMAIYGAPLYQPDHAYRACQTALEMMKELRQLNQRFQAQGKPVLNIGIGINSGKMVVGNIGSELKKDYTVIGDNVNLGSRLEGTNKQFNTNIIISEFTYELVKSFVKVKDLGEIIVKGKQKPVKIYELIEQ